MKFGNCFGIASPLLVEKYQLESVLSGSGEMSCNTSFNEGFIVQAAFCGPTSSEQSAVSSSRLLSAVSHQSVISQSQILASCTACAAGLAVEASYKLTVD